MPSSVRTKAAKKQSAFPAATASTETPVSAQEKRLSSAVLELEEACLTILLEHPEPVSNELEVREQARQLKNIATPVSLALRECKGPRRFHNHYRHDPKDYDTLTPVLEPSPYKLVADLCVRAMDKLSDFHVVESSELRREIALFKHALQDYLADYRETTKQ